MAVSNATRVPTSIWGDPDFTSMEGLPQLLWIYLYCRPRPVKFRAEVCAEQLNVNVEEIVKAAETLRASTYGTVFDRKRRVQTVTRKVRQMIHARDGHKCLACGATENLTIDHVCPVSRGGGDDPTNLQTLCHSCNCRKGVRVGVPD